MAWILQRSWRHPQRLPAGWRSERFARTVERTRRDLLPIGTLAALADHFGREGLYLATSFEPRGSRGAPGARSRRRPRRPWALELAYALRWIERFDGQPLGPWPAFCRAPLPAPGRRP